MKDFIRTLFGIRQKRKSLPPSQIPANRATLIRGGVKMTVNTQIRADLWDWLMLSGWRVNTFRNDRRKYSQMPDNALQQLMAVPSNERGNLHKKLLFLAAEAATKRGVPTRQRTRSA